MRRIFLSFVLALLSAGVFAQAVPATAPVPRVVFPVTTDQNIYKMGVGTANAANAANYSFGAAANGSIFANTTHNLPTAGGASIPIGVSGQIPKAAIASAFGRFFKKAIPLLSTGNALYDLAKELKVAIGTGQDGLPTFTQTNTTLNCNPQCYQYEQHGGLNFPAGTWVSSADAAAAYVVGHQMIAAHTGTVTGYVLSGSGATISANYAVYVSSYWGTEHISVPIASRTVAPYTSVSQDPLTADQFANAINNKIDYGPNTALARAVVDLIKGGEELAVQPSALSGPATGTAVTSEKTAIDTSIDPVTGAKTVTATKTVTQTQPSYQYGKDTVTVTETATSTSTPTITVTPAPTVDVPNPVPVTTTGTPTVTGTSTTAPKASESVDPCALNPNRIGCMDAGSATADPISKANHDVTVTPVTFLKNSACPTAQTFAVHGLSYSVSYQPLCDRLALLRFLFLAMAGFLAAYVLADSFRMT